jgi:hypothetical protein
MSVQVNGVLVEWKAKFNALSKTGTRNWGMGTATHRAAENTGRNGQFDALVWLEAVDNARGKQL